MDELSKLFLFRMTHIENVPHILQQGITHRDSPNRNITFVPIGDGSLIESRNNFVLPNQRTLGEYIPFYFGTRMPMLYVIQKGYNSVPIISPENVVYCISSVGDVLSHQLTFVFTDGHAVDALSSFFTPDAVTDIERIIDKKAIESKYWKDENDLDLKRRKEAELLLDGDLPIPAIRGYAVYNKNAQMRLLDFGVAETKVVVRPNYYF